MIPAEGVREIARKAAEKFARSKGLAEVSPEILDQVRAREK